MKFAEILLMAAAVFGVGLAYAQDLTLPNGLKLPELPVLSPTALTGDPGDGRVYLRWNLQLEDERVTGWKVIQLAPEKKTYDELLTNPATVIRGLQNGTAYTFSVVGQLKDGRVTPQSNTVTVTPRDTGVAKVQGIRRGEKITVGDREIELTGGGSRVIFPDGQELVFDRLRPVDWKTADGEHLIYPKHFGNGLDIGKFDGRGLPTVIPPEGLKRDTIEMDGKRWTTNPPGAGDNFSVRWEGQIKSAFSEVYTFYTRTDDGVRLWIDGRMIINRWQVQHPQEHSSNFRMEAGRKYDIRMEYFESGGGASARLMWSSPSQPKEIIPQAVLFPPNSEEAVGTGLQGTYFKNIELAKAEMTRIDPTIDFKWGMGGPFGEGGTVNAFYYQDLQSNFRHPHITDPMTFPLAGRLGNDNAMRWFEPTVDGNRVTFHYWQPLRILDYVSWNFVLVWETWWPIERDLHGTTYHGFARQIDVQMPSAWKDGYQVMLNNGFGPGGSRKGLVSYNTGFSNPAAEVIDFTPDENRMVAFQSRNAPRQGYGYHPDGDSMQSSPLIFYEWGTGSMTITCRSLYYHCSNGTASYPEQGADGVWPNLAWDLGDSGERTAVDTVEYLYTSDMDQPLPQRFQNARFEAYGNVSKRMGVQDTVGAVAMESPHSEIVRNGGGPRTFPDYYMKRVEGRGLDVIAMYHDIWHAVPITVDDAYRLDENYDCNPGLKAMNDIFHKSGYATGFWFRPEFVKTSITAALSETILTARTYYGYSLANLPDVVPLLEKRGMPIFRENTQWVRKQKDGSWPRYTPYQWIPMSLATGWWDRIMWPTLQMSSKLGFSRTLVDGGFGGLQGVDYAPMLNGKTDHAVACQPYWWRMWRSMYHVGIKMFGECTVGWKGGAVSAGGEGDDLYQWMFSLGWYIGVGGSLQSPEEAHKTFQLYASNRGDGKYNAVRRFARKFYEEHPAPDWIEFVDLHQVDEIEKEAVIGDSPVAGIGTRSDESGTKTLKVRPWVWGDVIWHYNNGTQVVYPAYDKINWNEQ